MGVGEAEEEGAGVAEDVEGEVCDGDGEDEEDDEDEDDEVAAVVDSAFVVLDVFVLPFFVFEVVVSFGGSNAVCSPANTLPGGALTADVEGLGAGSASTRAATAMSSSDAASMCRRLCVRQE